MLGVVFEQVVAFAVKSRLEDAIARLGWLVVAIRLEIYRQFQKRWASSIVAGGRISMRSLRISNLGDEQVMDPAAKGRLLKSKSKACLLIRLGVDFR